MLNYKSRVSSLTASLQCQVLSTISPKQITMGRSEKILIVGFVAFTAGASAFAHYYTMSEGYALKAIKDQERINNTSKEKTTTAAKPKAPTVGGVWGNIAKQRDAIKNSKKQ